MIPKNIFLAIIFSSVSTIALQAQTTVNFKHTGKTEIFIVPQGVTSITVDMAGGSGGNIGEAIGGKGGRVQCVVQVTPGETLRVNVGGAGLDGDNKSGIIKGGFNGGGTGYDDDDSWGGGSGGGASDITRTPFGLKNRIVVAGGAGGGGIDGCSSSYMLYGGNGGGLIAADAQPAKGGGCDGSGFGGTQTEGGKKGNYTLNPCENRSTDGKFGQGGNAFGACDNSDDGGSGGGGGWYGGGSGNFGAGGGGSSHTADGCTNVEHTQGYQQGDGYITITYGAAIKTVVEKLNANASALPAEICKGTSTVLTVADITGGTPPYSCLWTPGNLYGNVINVNPSKNTIYTVHITDNSGNTFTQTVEIFVKSALSISITSTHDSICPGENTTLNATKGMSYKWLPAEGLSNAYIQNPTANPSTTTCYTVIVTDENGCTGSATKCVAIKKCKNIKEVGLESIYVFYNAANNEFIVYGLVAPENEVKILSGTGDVLLTKNAGPGNCILSASKLPDGMYYVTIKTKVGMVKKKVVKK
jgi:hypothetical protein